MPTQRFSAKISDGVTLNLGELRSFLIDAKRATYAGDGKEEKDPQRPGHKELVYADEPWSYRDSYAAHYCAPGVETVAFKGLPAWQMSYVGGMEEPFWGNEKATNDAFAFLKAALLKANIEAPFRGPPHYREGSYEYFSEVSGDVMRFVGRERIEFTGLTVFSQDYIGGLYVYRGI